MKKWRTLKSILDIKELEYKAFKTNGAGDATRYAEKITSLADDDIRLIIVGGDGTLNEVINGITDFSKVKIGLIPIGSGNDFANCLDIKESQERILFDILSKDEQFTNDSDVITEKKRRKEAVRTSDTNLEEETPEYTEVDLGKVVADDKISRLFAISSGVGLDAIVTKTVNEGKLKYTLNKLHIGKLSYGIQTVGSLFSMDTFAASGESDLEGRLYGQVIFAAVMNVRCEGGGVPMAPEANPYDGHLSVCCAHSIPKWKTFMLFPKLLAAKHTELSGFDILETYSLSLSFDKAVVLHTDGEYLGDVKKVRFECLHGVMKLLNTVPMPESQKHRYE